MKEARNALSAHKGGKKTQSKKATTGNKNKWKQQPKHQQCTRKRKSTSPIATLEPTVADDDQQGDNDGSMGGGGGGGGGRKYF